MARRGRPGEFAAQQLVDEYTLRNRTSNRTTYAPAGKGPKFLNRENAIFKFNKDRWEINERRGIGGDAVKDELVPFSYELERGPASQYGRRQEQMLYLNFPEIFTTVVSGHLVKFAPDPFNGSLLFGPMGEVREEVDWENPSDAEMLYHSVDKANGNGVSWTQWWLDTLKLAMFTGHRWLYVDLPQEEASSRADVIDGKRPYIVEFSPLDVPDWRFNESGNLLYAIVKFNPDGDLNRTHKLLLVRKGFTEFDEPGSTIYASGGWFKFDEHGLPYADGTFDDCFGEIPFFPFFYERSKGTKGVPMLSRPGTTELGNAAVAFANVHSSANFQAWKAGGAVEFLAGVDEDGMEFVNQQYTRGDSLIGIPPNEDTEATPEVYSSGSTSSGNTNFTERENAITFVAAQLGIGEVMGTNQSSQNGASQSAQFSVTQVPRILRAIQNMRTAQLQALKFFAYRFGHAQATGFKSAWPDKVDLVELIDRIQEFFTVERLSGIRSKTADAKAMTTFYRERVGGTQEELKAIQSEYEESAEMRDEAAANAMAGLPGDTLAQPGGIGGPMKNERQQAGDKAREANKKINKGNTSNTRQQTKQVRTTRNRS